MKVQRVRLPDRVAWMVLDDSYEPIQPILSYLKFLADLDRSPNTIRSHACHLKLFWEYLRDEHLSWIEIDVAQLAAFITWLRRPDPSVVSIGPQKARRTNATIDQTIGSVQSFYAFHARLGTVPELPLYQLSMRYGRQYKPFLHGIAKAKPEQQRVVAVKREQRKPKTLTHEQIETLIAACTHTRDKLLLTLMYHTGQTLERSNVQEAERLGAETPERSDSQTLEDSGTVTPERPDSQTLERSEPKASKRERHTIYLPPDLSEWLKIRAVKTKREISELATEALERYRSETEGHL